MSDELMDGYHPTVGDIFDRATSFYKTADGHLIERPAGLAKVTIVDHSHVVSMINSKEYTMVIPEFIRLAKTAVSNGAKFIPASKAKEQS